MLHCPATLFIARHGDAEYDGDRRVMSDEGGRLSQTGQVQVTECAHEIADQKLAMVYSSPMQRALESGRLAAEVLDIGHRTLDGLVEIRVGSGPANRGPIT